MASTSFVPTTFGPSDSSEIPSPEESKSMEKLSPTVTLSFNKLCDDSLEITRITLVKNSVSLLSGHFSDLADVNARIMEEQAVNVSEDDEMYAADPDSLQNASPHVIIGGNISKTELSSSLELEADDILAAASGSSAEQSATEERIADGIQDIGVIKPSSCFSNCTTLWGHVSICGRRPEIEDAVSVVPSFAEIPLQLLPTAHQSIGHFFGVYDGHGGAQVPLSLSISLSLSTLSHGTHLSFFIIGS